MRDIQAESAPPAGRVRPDRRRDPRRHPAHLYTSVGRVIDLSAGGMRVLSSRELAGTLEVAVYRRHERPVIVRSTVLWSRRVGFDRFLAGLAFRDRSRAFLARLQSYLHDADAEFRPAERIFTGSATGAGGDAAHE